MRAVVIFEYDLDEVSDPRPFYQQVAPLVEASRGMATRPRMTHLAIRQGADRVMRALDDQKKEDEHMALRKHGEGEVIPETPQQKTAAQEGSQGLTQEAIEEIQNEGQDEG
jgi:hypothetical protein